MGDLIVVFGMEDIFVGEIVILIDVIELLLVLCIDELIF